MNEEIIQKPRASEPPQAVVSGTSAKEAAELLFSAPHRGGARASARDRAGAEGRRQYRRLLARADGARASGARHLVPASLHRRAERRHAPAPADRADARAVEPARHVRPCAGRGRRRGRAAARDRDAPVELAHPPGDHRASDRVEARHRAREISPHLSAPARARDAALDRARAHRADRRSARSDRARVDDGRAASGEADRAARGLQRAAFLRREPVREGAGDALPARRRARAILSGHALRARALLPVRLVDRRRPRRQPVGHHARSPAGPCARTRSPRSATIASASTGWRSRCRSPSALCRCRRASAPSSHASSMQAGKARRSRRAIRASPTANISRSCCASSTRRSRACRAWRSADQARPMPMPTS